MLDETQRTLVSRIGEPVQNTERALSFINRATQARVDQDSRILLIGFVYPSTLYLKDFRSGWVIEVTTEEFNEYFSFEPFPFQSFLDGIDAMENVKDVYVTPSSSDTVSFITVVLNSGTSETFRASLDELTEARKNVESWISKQQNL